MDAVQLNVVPLRPIPIYVAVLAREAAYHVGRHGHNVMCVPYATLDRFAEIGALIAEFRRGRAEAGVASDRDESVFAFHTHVAKSDEAHRINFFNCFPVKWYGPTLNAQASGHATERVEIAFEEMKLEK